MPVMICVFYITFIFLFAIFISYAYFETYLSFVYITLVNCVVLKCLTQKVG